MSLTRLAAMGCLVIGAATAALAAEPVAGLRAPERLTAGSADEFLGSAGPDGATLFFVSNRNATAQVFTQAPGGTPTLVFDEGADTSFPRVSPDGKRLAYLSTRTDATGDVCIRTLPDGDRRCLTGPETAETAAFWFPDSQSLGVVQRHGMQGDLQLRRIDLQGHDAGPVIAETGISSPALHPDGQWVAWVPVERASQEVGIAFSMRPAEHLRLARIGQTGHQDVVLPLPGVTGFPAFAVNGQFLYFSQHLSDTNQDGRIDGHDHSVLFRIRFDASTAHPLDGTRPEQLTSAHWNCQYPAPTRDALLTTCEVDGSLDVYRLPLDGALSAAWSAAKLREVHDAVRNPWEQLLVLSHVFRQATTAADRMAVLREMTRIHLQLGELTSVEFYAHEATRLLAGDAPIAAWSAVVLEIVAHRMDERRLAGGTLDDRFLAAQRDRVRRLGQWAKKVGAVRDLAKLAQVEVLDVMGEEQRAVALLQTVPISQIADSFTLFFYADKGLYLLRALGQREPLLARLAELASHPVLEGAERLDFAERFVAELGAGVGVTQRQQRVAAWLPKAEPEGELAFRLTLESHLLTLNKGNQEAVRAALFQLYKHHDQPERRRALVAATARRAAELDCADLLYQFANTWVSQVPATHPERDAAVALYRQVGLDKAWIHRADKQLGDARGTFWGLTLQTDDLEAHAGFIEARLAEGKSDVLELYRNRFPADHPLLHFAQAWLLARDLAQPAASSARASALDLAEDHARLAAMTVSQSTGLSQLRGYLRHEQYLLHGNRQAGIEAVEHYQMALDLAQGRPRYQAALLSNLGLLQAELGNHALALGLLDRRQQLPARDAGEALSRALARARSLHHMGEAKGASQEAERALALVAAKPELADRRWLTVDRTALMAYAAGHAVRAQELYGELLRHAPPQADGALEAANKLRWTLMAAAATARAGDARQALLLLGDAERQLAALRTDDLATGASVTSRTPPLTRDDVAILLNGLRAESARLASEPELALSALAARLMGQQTAFHDTDDEDLLLDLAETELRIAAVHRDLGHTAEARVHLENALGFTAEYQKRTGSVAPDGRIALVRAYAEGLLAGKLGATPAPPALLAALRDVYAFLCERANPAREHDRFWIGLYLTLFDLDSKPPANPAGGVP